MILRKYCGSTVLWFFLICLSLCVHSDVLGKTIFFSFILIYCIRICEMIFFYDNWNNTEHTNFVVLKNDKKFKNVLYYLFGNLRLVLYNNIPIKVFTLTGFRQRKPFMNFHQKKKKLDNIYYC